MVCLRTEGTVIVAVGRVRSDRLVDLLEGYRHHEHHAARILPVETVTLPPFLALHVGLVPEFEREDRL